MTASGWRAAVTGGLPKYWGVTPAEQRRAHPGVAWAVAPYTHLVRAIDVAADPDIVYRWLCQLTVAPYSYDLIDNLGRRSPRELTPGADALEIGQRAMIGRIVAFEPGRFLTVLSGRRSDRIFGGPIVLTFSVAEAVSPSATSRIVVDLAVTAQGPAARARRWLLTWGDLVMMRKQLRTLKGLAERDGAARSTAAGGA